MKGYYRRLSIVVAVACLVGVLFWGINTGWLVGDAHQAQQSISMEGEAQGSVTAEEMAQASAKALVIYDPQEEGSVNLEENLQRVLYHLRMQAEYLPVTRRDSVSYRNYDLVIVATGDLEKGIGTDSSRLFEAVEGGTRLLLTSMPTNIDGVLRQIYRKLGVLELKGYCNTQGFAFEEELMPGSAGERFAGDGFADSALEVSLDSGCTVYAQAFREGGGTVPMVWTAQFGGGSVGVINSTSAGGDYWTGLLAGSVTALFDTYLYPVINTKTVFIDDFPSPQYNSDSDVIRQAYNRTVREFYRDIWWPDMQSAAKQAGVKYTGLFMATYNNIVDPEDFTFGEDPMEQYFGNSLLRGGYEMGAHGYNHQSLGLAGQIPAEMGYRPWATVEDMAASIRQLLTIAEEMFPNVTLYTYVPPSNYLSQEGREAVKLAMPDLQVISGVYTMEGEEGAVYVQDFRVAEDGIAEFPRFSSGMLVSDYDRFCVLNGLGLYGVFSHFLHPDDILDAERGGGLAWQELLDRYSQLLDYVNEKCQGLRGATAVEAGTALRMKEALTMRVEYGEDQVTGSLGNFYGQASFYLRTEKTPQVDNESCTITRLCQEGTGYYYLVTVKQPEFSFLLK